MRGIIHPTVGRVVEYWPSTDDNSIDKQMALNCAGQPMASLVTYVWSPRMVNLVVFDHNGMPHSRTSVALRQPGDGEVPPVYPHASWMEYQIGQAGKTEQVLAAAGIGGPVGGVGAKVDDTQGHSVVEPAA